MACGRKNVKGPMKRKGKGTISFKE